MRDRKGSTTITPHTSDGRLLEHVPTTTTTGVQTSTQKRIIATAFRNTVRTHAPPQAGAHERTNA